MSCVILFGIVIIYLYINYVVLTFINDVFIKYLLYGINI